MSLVEQRPKESNKLLTLNEKGVNMKKSYEQTNLEQLLSGLIRAEGKKDLALEIVKRENPFLMKAAVGSSSSSDLSGSFDHLIAGQYFLSLDQGQLGIFDTIKAFTRQAAYRTPLYLGGGIVANIVPEGTAVPVSKYSVDSSGLTPTKAAGIAITTKEAAATREGIASLETDLRQELMTATDRQVLSISAAGAGFTAAASSDAVADLTSLLLAVNLSGFGQLFWIVSPSVAVVLSTMRGVGGELVFPGMAAKGGELFNVSAMVTSALTDSIMLIDPSGIATGSEDLRIDLSTAAMLEMDSTPEMNSSTPTGPTGKLVSLFQSDCIGVLGIRTFAAKLVRPSACAVLEAIQWIGMPETTTTTGA
jgi:hypothetical protein